MNSCGRFLAWALVFAYAATSSPAQEGNGQGQAYIDPSQAIIGQPFTISLGAANVPNGDAGLSGAASFGPTVVPGWGTFWLDLTSPTLFHIPVTLDANGAMQMVAFIPNDPALLSFPPVYLYAIVVDLSLAFPPISVSKTVRVQFDYARRFSPTTNAMATARGLHTANSLTRYAGDNRTSVVVAGGGAGSLLAPTATNTSEIYQPLTRSFVPGPDMQQARIVHRSVRLQDGRVLYTGGITPAGPATASCEIYDPASNTFTATGSMAHPRAGHGLTLLNDGRVLATGGLADYTAANVDFLMAMNSAQNSAEIYDPGAGTWSPVAAPMSSARVGHAQLLMPDGSVLITGGAAGGATANSYITAQIYNTLAVPNVVATCEAFDPVTEQFQPRPSMLAVRAFHGMSLVGASGEVLVTGGFNVGSQAATLALSTCERFNGTSWQPAPNLPWAAAFHTQVQAADGSALVAGGLTGLMVGPTATSMVVRHTGLTVTSTPVIGAYPERGLTGVPGGRGAHTCTRLYDGSFLLAGGWSANATPQNGAWVTYDN